MEGRYQTLQKLGEGSFGACTLVRERSTNRRFVCKSIRLTAVTAEELAEVNREVEILKQLHHPHIIRYVESFRSRSFLNIVMEYAEGGDLLKFLQSHREHPISETEILRLLGQIALAVQYLHRKNILHRDLKPQNIFLTKSGDVKVGDFGASKVLKSRIDSTKTYVGTPYYLSPEIIAESSYSFPTDIWSLGVLIFELCAKRPPFNGRTIPELLRAVGSQPAPPLPRLYSPLLSALVSSMLSKVPQRRPTISIILKNPLLSGALRNLMHETIRRNRQLKTETIRRIQQGVREIPPEAKGQVADPCAKIFGADPQPLPTDVVEQDLSRQPEQRQALLREVKNKRKMAYAEPLPIACEDEDEEVERDYKENVQKVLEIQKALVEVPEDVVVKPAPIPHPSPILFTEYEDLDDVGMEPVPAKVPLLEPPKTPRYAPGLTIRDNLIKRLGEETFQRVYLIFKRLRKDPNFSDCGIGSYRPYLNEFMSPNMQIVVVPQFKVMLNIEDQAERPRNAQDR